MLLVLPWYDHDNHIGLRHHHGIGCELREWSEMLAFCPKGSYQCG